MEITIALKRKLAWIQKRYVIAVMGFLAISNAYSMRICLSVAIVEMVTSKNLKNSSSIRDSDICLYYDENNAIPSEGIYDWSEKTQGFILGSFFWGYAITHIPGGRIADIYGGKHALGFGLLMTALFTILTPVVADKGGSTWMIVIRILEGLGEGVTYPALNTILAKWIPPCEKGRLGSLVFSGAQMGTVIGTALSGPLIAHYGWPSVFYTFGLLGICWFILWNLTCFSDPQSHPWISEEELKYLEKEMSTSTSNKIHRIPWRKILTSVPLWGLVAGQIGHDWGFYTLVTDLPKYMKDILHFSITENSGLSSVPNIVMWLVAITSGWLADWILVHHYLSTTTVRKLFTTVGSIGPAFFLVGASYAGCDRKTVVVLFTIAMGLMGAYYPGVKVNALDLSSNYAGLLMAITNGLAALTGIITPYLIGEIATHQSITEWRVVFYISMGVFVVTNIIYVLTASGEEQPWNRTQNCGHLESGDIYGENEYKRKATESTLKPAVNHS